MQPFDFSCPHCRGTLRVSIAELVGRRVRCPHCRQAMVVEAPEQQASQSPDSFASWAQQAQQQVGSGPRVGSESGLALADDSDSGMADQHHVWGDDQPSEDEESVLGGERPDAWKDEDPEGFDPAALVEHVEPDDGDEDSAEAAIVEPPPKAAIVAKTATVEAESVEDVADEDDPPSVELASPSERSSYRAPRAAGSSGSMNPMVLIGGGVAALLIVVALGVILSSGNSSGRSRTSAGKVQRRNPQEFQDFARDAARKGWPGR